VEIHVIGRQAVSIDVILDFLESQGLSWRRTEGATPPEELVEVAGRICYLSFGDRQTTVSNEEFIGRLISNGHESVLEHVSWTFLVTGVSRSLTHQLVRHRVGFSYSQLSQQYHDERSAEFVEPSLLKDIPEARVIWETAVLSARDAYMQIMKHAEEYLRESREASQAGKADELARSVARSVLPNATETRLVLTVNARALRRFFAIRGSTANDPEMRYFAVGLLKHVAQDSPSLFADFQIRMLPDGSEEIIRTNAV